MGDVTINVLLNSSQVPREVVKYVIYHELLHRYYSRHDPIFRKMEHQYPNYVELERFLDYRLPRLYDFPYWDENNREAVETLFGEPPEPPIVEIEDAEAQYRLGDKYYYGKEVEQDYDKALSYYKKAADAGYVKAQHSLGYMYKSGIGVKRDFDQAFFWYNKAAESGHTNAQYKLGCMYEYYEYEHGNIRQDLDLALFWYGKAAGAGHAEAKMALKRLQEKS